MNADSLQAPLTDYFRAHAASFGLDQASLVIEYVLNWGGFVNYSYRIGDARRAYHLKLSTSSADREALRRWHTLAPLLGPYHAPPIVEWIDLGVAAGLLFPFIPGASPALREEVVAELLPVLARLNADRELEAALRGPRTITAHDVYRDSFHDRFSEDLRGIRDAPPGFVSADLLHWLEAEVEALAELVTATPAFAEPLTSPVHGDLWLNNILWLDGNSWYLVDWDDLRIGDPAADLATLFGPTAQDLRPLKMSDRVVGSLSPAQRERWPHLGRVTLLDWVIDPVSDWLDARTAPAHEHKVRMEKERIHRLALDQYKRLYK